MTKDECRKNDEIRMTNSARPSSAAFRPSLLIRASSFVLRRCCSMPLLFQLEVARRPFLRHRARLFLHGGCWQLEPGSKLHIQKFEDAFGRCAMRRGYVFIKQHERLEFIFAKIIGPVLLVIGDVIVAFVDRFEIEARCGVRLGAFAAFLAPNFRLRGDRPRDGLLEPVAPAQPDVFRLAKYGRQHLLETQMLVGGNLAQHSDRAFEIGPHHDETEPAIWWRPLAPHALNVGGARWTLPFLLPSLSALANEILSGATGDASAAQDAGKQVRAAALDRTDDVRNGERHCWLDTTNS